MLCKHNNCKYKSKQNGFCGYHKNKCLDNIDILTIHKSKQNSKQINTVQNDTSTNDIQICKLLPKDSNSNEKQISKLLPKDSNTNEKQISKLLKKDLIIELSHYNLNIKGSKSILCHRLKHIRFIINYFNTHTRKLLMIQKIWRKQIVLNKIKLQGETIYNKTKCNNSIDFCTLEDLIDIEDNYYFSYRDIDNFYYGFDIRSLYQLYKLNKLNENPYNRNKLSMVTKEKITKLINRNLINKHNMEYEEIQLTKQQKYNQKIISIFQKIDELKYHTNINWFNELNIYKLKDLYRQIEDIWNYRANLSQQQKMTIVPNKNIFSRPNKFINSITNIDTIRNILLNDIDDLISLGQTTDDRILGATYFLTGLVMVSKGCAESYPFLIQ